jgi:hypothetical protein
MVLEQATNAALSTEESKEVFVNIKFSRKNVNVEILRNRPHGKEPLKSEVKEETAKIDGVKEEKLKVEKHAKLEELSAEHKIEIVPLQTIDKKEEIPIENNIKEVYFERTNNVEDPSENKVDTIIEIEKVEEKIVEIENIKDTIDCRSIWHRKNLNSKLRFEKNFNEFITFNLFSSS